MLTDDDTTPFFPPEDDHIPTADGSRSPSNKSQSIASHFNLPFLYFTAAGILTLFLALLATIPSTEFNDIAYICAGIIGISICGFAIKHFRTVINLSVSIDHFDTLNRTFKKERRRMQSDLDRLSSAQVTLKDTHHRLSDANKKNRENLIQFRTLQDSMDQYNATCAEELQNAVAQAKALENTWHKELYQHQRNLLHHLFDQFSSCQHHIGMTKDEFIAFSKHLPIEYQDRFRRMGTFDALAGDKPYILLEDFEKTLDIFAEMQASDCDIEFHIQPTEKKRNVNPRRALRTRKIQHMKHLTAGSLAPLGSILETRSIDSMHEEDSEESEDDRPYGDNLITYERQVVITRRSYPGESLGELHAMVDNHRSGADRLVPAVSSNAVSPSSPGRRLHRTATHFQNEFITDLSELYEMPDIEFMKTDELEVYDFSDQQMNKYLQQMKK